MTVWLGLIEQLKVVCQLCANSNVWFCGKSHFIFKNVTEIFLAFGTNINVLSNDLLMLVS